MPIVYGFADPDASLCINIDASWTQQLRLECKQLHFESVRDIESCNRLRRVMRSVDFDFLLSNLLAAL